MSSIRRQAVDLYDLKIGTIIAPEGVGKSVNLTGERLYFCVGVWLISAFRKYIYA